MANSVYPSFLDATWNGLFNIGSDVYKAAILGPGYVFSSAHTKLSDLSSILGTGTLSGVASSGGVLDADDTVVASLSAGNMNSVVVYQYNSGTPANSRLMFYFDQGVGFSVGASGQVTIIWPDTTNVKIFPLGGL